MLHKYFEAFLDLLQAKLNLNFWQTPSRKAKWVHFGEDKTWGMEGRVLCSGDAVPSQLGVSSCPSTNTYRGALGWYLINCSSTVFLKHQRKHFWQEKHGSNRPVKLTLVPPSSCFLPWYLSGSVLLYFPKGAQPESLPVEGAAVTAPSCLLAMWLSHRVYVNGRRDAAPPRKFLYPSPLSWLRRQLKFTSFCDCRHIYQNFIL